MGHNHIGSYFGNYLSKFLQENKTLTNLCLSATAINNPSSFQNSLSLHPTLRKFEFAENRIGDSGGITLVESVSLSSSIQELDVSANLLTNSFLNSSSLILQSKNKFLHEVNIKRNKFSNPLQIVLALLNKYIKEIKLDIDIQGPICDGIQEV